MATGSRSLGAGHVHPGVPHVADQEHVRPLHLLEHGKEPLIVQGEVLELRVDLHPVDAVVPQPLQLLPVVLVLGVEGAAGDELGVLPALLVDEAVDGLHLVGGGGGGEHHGVLDPRLRQHVRQLLTFPWWLGGSGRSKYWAVATVAFSATLSGKMWVCMSMTLMGMLLRLG